jgi:hypothetical protein
VGVLHCQRLVAYAIVNRSIIGWQPASAERRMLRGNFARNFFGQPSLAPLGAARSAFE